MQFSRFIFILIIAAIVQVGCQNKKKESVLVIAVDDLVSTDVSCGKDASSGSRSGFQILCNEAVRFTHAFTTSTMSVPAMGSLLTATYPFQNGLRHNGQYLSTHYTTVAKQAVQKHYRTGFFSGGAPLIRKTGVNQGFEYFDDNVNFDLNTFFRPLSKSVQLFNQWHKQEVGNSPYFAVLYAPDLIFTNTETTSDLGEPRNLSYESQLDELDETLFNFFESLKAQSAWDNTVVILVGLNGHTNSDRPNEPTVLNLHGESTQIALFIKPAQKKRDEGITWKIDDNVSLADVGKTLFEIMNLQAPNTHLDFPIESLASALRSPESKITEDRPILVESAWGSWKNLSNIRSAVIKNHTLFINDEKTLVYNTLVDRLETNPLPASDSYLFSPHSVVDLLLKNGFQKWNGISENETTKLNLNSSRWTKKEQNISLLNDLLHLYKKKSTDYELLNWVALLMLEQKDWEGLKSLGSKNNEPLWSYVAERNILGTTPTKSKTQEPCLNLLKEKIIDASMLKTCSDPVSVVFIEWQRSEALGLQKETQKKKFERLYKQHKIDLAVARINIGIGKVWDINHEIRFAPEKIDLVLALPEYQKIFTQIERSIRVKIEE